jgi:S-adenosylmethionine hydrolase
MLATMLRQNRFLRSCAVFLGVLLCAGSILAQDTAAKPRPTIVFMTDFGIVDDSVALCKGVMYSIAPDVRIVDLTHQVTPFSISDGARFLYGTTPYFPQGTIFVVVVDPTVGSSRKAIIVKSKRSQFFVLPDNGLMTMVQDRDGLESAREITNPQWMIGAALSSTFHGRDIFSPAGAHLAHGDDWTQVGPELDLAKLVRLDLKPAMVDEQGLKGEIIAIDGPFGNLITNISSEKFTELGYKHGEVVPVMIGSKRMNLPFMHTFSDVPLNQPLMYIDSRGRLGIAVNQGSFANRFGVRPPVAISIPRHSKKE